MIDISKILAGWISSWVENDLGGFRLGGKWLKVWVDFGRWITAGGKRLGGFWMGGFRPPPYLSSTALTHGHLSPDLKLF